MSSFFDTSPTIPCAPACSRTTRSTGSRRRATNATWASRLSSSRMSANPRPEVPPVIATFKPRKLLQELSYIEVCSSPLEALLAFYFQITSSSELEVKEKIVIFWGDAAATHDQRG